RSGGFKTRLGRGEIMVPEPFHGFKVERVSGAELAIGLGVGRSVQGGAEQNLEVTVGTAALLSEHSYDSGHISAGAVAREGKSGGIEAEFVAVLGDPFGCGIGFFVGDGIARFR